MNTTTGRIAAAVGAVYVLVGIAGFVVTSLATGQDGHGQHVHLLVFRINPLHNVAHLALGALLIAGAVRGADAARQAMLVVGLVFLLLSVVGPLVVGTSMNLVALNAPDHVLHGATAVTLVAGAILAGRRKVATP